MPNASDLRLLIASRYPLIVVTEDDEERFLSLLRAEAGKLPSPVWTWSATHGLARDGMSSQYGTAQAIKALEFIAQVTDPGVFVFADASAALTDPLVVRQIKDIAQRGRAGQSLILASPAMEVPAELGGLAARWTLSPPSAEELEALVQRISDDLARRGVLPAPLDEVAVRSLGESLLGLSAAEAEQVVRRTALERGSLEKEALGAARDAKAQVLGSGGVIELVGAGSVRLDDVGGMANLKEWLEVRGRAFEPAAKAFGVDPPRGVLLTGIPGCGKSFIAKALARTWNLPLVLLDPARLYGQYVGQSEERLHDSLTTVQTMAPVVLWVDELEKGFAAGGEGDGGVSERILGTFLRWMQDREPGAFLVATANDVAALPPELLRKGRFDEIFFVDLPKEAERRDIFRMQLARRKRDPASFDLDALSTASEGFSGAEIEAAVVATLYDAYASSSQVTTERVVDELKRTTPLSRTRAEDVDRLREWARDRAVAA